MKTINIINDSGFYADNTAELLTDGTMQITVNLPKMHGDFFMVATNAGRHITKHKLASGEIFTISGLKAGVFTATLKHYLRGELVSVYPVETLILKDVDGKVYAVPEVEELKTRLSAAEKRMDRLEQDNITLTAAVKKIHARLKTLEKFNEGD